MAFLSIFDNRSQYRVGCIFFATKTLWAPEMELPKLALRTNFAKNEKEIDKTSDVDRNYMYTEIFANANFSKVYQISYEWKW